MNIIERGNRKIAREIRKSKQKKKREELIKKVLNAESSFKEYERKSYEERKKELNKIYDEIGAGLVRKYNEYGFDAKGYKDYNDYVDTTFLRSYTLLKNKPITSIITNDKFLTSLYLSSADPNIVPRTLGLYDKGKQILVNYEDKTIEQYIKNMECGKVCFKLLDTCGGEGFYLLEKKKKGKKEELIVNYGNVTYDEFIKDVKSARYLIQEHIEQHPDMAKLNKDSLNTIRMVTVNVNGEIKFLAAMCRFGFSGSAVDNGCAGGLYTGVNDDGTLKKEGFTLTSHGIYEHPETGLKFEGYQLPFFEEAKEVVIKYHHMFPGLESLGWDIAITKKGPVIIETNANWATFTVQQCNYGFRKKIEEFFNEDYLTLNKRTIKEIKEQNKKKKKEVNDF